MQNRIQTATQQVKVECWVCAITTCSSGGPTIGYGNSEWTPSFNAELQNYPEPAQIIFSVGVNTGQTFTSNTGTDQFTTTTIDTSTAHPWDANSYACRWPLYGQTYNVNGIVETQGWEVPSISQTKPFAKASQNAAQSIEVSGPVPQ